MPHFASYSSDVELFMQQALSMSSGLRIEIERCLNSKKAPLGRFFTLVGRAGFEPATN